MFRSHENYGFNNIELHILLQQPQQSQLSLVVDQSQVFMVNHEQDPLPSSHMYCPPEHMTNLNLDEVKISSDIFYNSYM